MPLIVVTEPLIKEERYYNACPCEFKPMIRSQNENKKFRKFLLDLPKTEIHLHLEGLASVETIWNLIQDNDLEYDDIKTKKDLKKKFLVKSLDEFIALFINVIQNSFQKEEDLQHLIKDARDYLRRNNIFYAEIFFAPSKFILNGFDYAKMADILDEGARMIKRKDKRTIKFILDVSRTYGVDNAMKNLDLMLSNPRDSFIGIGLGGAESQGPAEEYEPVFAKARLKGLQVVAHAGEVEGPFSIWDSLRKLQAARIGHGISAIQDDELMDYLVENKIPLEICPTSNIFTRHYVKNLEEHPIKPFYDRGITVTLNTDDPTLFGIELIDEYMNLVDAGIFTPGEILQILKNTHFSTFMTVDEKKASWEKIQKKIDKSSFGR